MVATCYPNGIWFSGRVDCSCFLSSLVICCWNVSHGQSSGQLPSKYIQYMSGINHFLAPEIKQFSNLLSLVLVHAFAVFKLWPVKRVDHSLSTNNQLFSLNSILLPEGIIWIVYSGICNGKQKGSFVMHNIIDRTWQMLW